MITYIILGSFVYMIMLVLIAGFIHNATAKGKEYETMKEKQIRDSLDWMLQHNIITYQEYNELLIKSLPYLEG